MRDNRHAVFANRLGFALRNATAAFSGSNPSSATHLLLNECIDLMVSIDLRRTKETCYDQTMDGGPLVCCLILRFRGVDQVSAVVGLQRFIDFSYRFTVEAIWVPCPRQERNRRNEQRFKKTPL